MPPAAPAPVPPPSAAPPVVSPLGPPPSPPSAPPPVGAPAPSSSTELPAPSEPAHPPSSSTAPGGGPCPSCSFQNPPGFKFCGRCGATLEEPAPSAPADVGNANTIFISDASEVQAAAAAHQAEQAAAEPPQPEPPVVAEAVDPTHPSERLTAPNPIEDVEPEPEHLPATIPGVESKDDTNPAVADDEPQTQPKAVMPTPPIGDPDGGLGGGPGRGPGNGPPAKLVMLGPDGQPVGERTLTPGERLDVGRESGPPWDDDAYLDPQHAYVTVVEEGLLIEDTGSLNGVFVKLSARVEVQDGDQFRVGQELVQYEDLPEPTPTPDGTERMGSPNPGYWGRLSILVDPDSPSMAFPIDGEGIMIGREHGDITFPQDGYVSGKHCRVVGDDTGVYMEDLGSSNGTYMRVRSGVILPFGSLVLIGQKLFQVERLD